MYEGRQAAGRWTFTLHAASEGRTLCGRKVAAEHVNMMGAPIPVKPFAPAADNSCRACAKAAR